MGYPHHAYPHGHDYHNLWPKLQQNSKNYKAPSINRIFQTPCRRIGQTTEFINADYQKTLINLAVRLGGKECILISNHISSDREKKTWLLTDIILIKTTILE